MIAKHAPRVFALLLALVVATSASQAFAYCASCTSAPAVTYSAGYAAAPVAYTAAYAPAPVAYTTAYAPAYTTYRSGWYPGRFLGRVNRAIWGYPTTTYTAAYAPAYTAAYAPSVSYASYAPACTSCTASYAPACSTCTASYAPACDTCSACTVSYAPACSTCSVCDACAAIGTTCASCAAGSVSQATYVDSAPSTYGPRSSSNASSGPAPEIDPNQAVPSERSLRQTEKPIQPTPADDATPPATDEDVTPNSDSSTQFDAPQLFDPNDRTAERHRAPVWTAVYHKTGVGPATQTVSWTQQAEIDAEGWTSASE